jgi:TRAP-type C4-dicarboxylate transport system substrate-binding protein
LTTTMKRAEGAKLEESGVIYCTEIREYMLYYGPLVSLKFWDSLPPDLQNMMLDVWNEHVPKVRELARKMQDEAGALLTKRGVEIFRPKDAALAKWRERVMPIQEPFVKSMEMTPALADMAQKMLGM